MLVPWGEAVTSWEGWLGSLGSKHPLGLFQEKLDLLWSRGKAQLASHSLFQLYFL